MTDERMRRLLAARLAERQTSYRLPSVAAGLVRGLAHRFRRAGDGIWTGLDGYFAGEPLRPVRGQDGRVAALDLASHTYTRLPYDVAAPVPGGVDPGGWRG
jgi:hypothetical protein